LLIALFLPAALGAAEVHDPFLVRNLVEDIHDANLVQARNQAFRLGQREAYQALMQRITAQSDWPKVPRLDDAELEDLVLDVGIDQEKQAPGRLIATLSVRFKADGVRKLLRGAGIAYAEWRGRPVIILPLWQTDAGVFYADGANPWRDLWRSGAIQGLVPLAVLPPAELSDGISPSALAQPSDEVLNALAQRLNNPDLLIMLAAAGKNDNGTLKLDLTVTGSGPLAGSMGGQRGYGGEPAETLDQLLNRAGLDLARAIDDGWKSANLLQYDKQGSLAALAPLGGFEDWLAIRNKLARATAVRSYDISALSRNEAELVLHYVGEQGQLESVLVQNGLVLTWEDQHWALRNSGGR
jgi:hypothetical protein